MDKAEQPTTQALKSCRYCGGQKRFQIVSPVSDHAWADCFCVKDRTTSLTAQDGLICTGCGSTKSIEQIRAEHPSALSCCPERKMVSQSKAAQDGLVEALRELEQAEAAYRHTHDLLGSGDILTGRAWDKMRRAGDRARQALSAIKEQHHD